MKFQAVKKIIAVGLLLVAGGCTSCGNVKKESIIIASQEHTTQVKSENTYITKSEDNKNSLLSGTYKILTKKNPVYINVPTGSSYTEREKGFTEMFTDYKTRIIAVTGFISSKEQCSTLEDVYEIMFSNVRGALGSYWSLSETSYTHQDKMTINGIEMLRCEGTVKNDYGGVYDAYIVGYYFLIEDTPCSVIGFVKDKEQPQDIINEVRDYVDAMVKTIKVNA